MDENVQSGTCGELMAQSKVRVFPPPRAPFENHNTEQSHHHDTGGAHRNQDNAFPLHRPET